MKVEVENISKSYKGNIILDNISCVFESGKIYGLLGINGAGKSSFMKILYGMNSQDQGQILYDGRKSISSKDIGALIERPAIYDNLSALDNLRTKALLYNIDKEEIDKVLKIIGLESVGKKRAGKFSLGMKQRLGIGMAILTNPKFLILDEPTNGLDPEGIEQLLEMTRVLKEKGMTILFSSHQLHEVQEIADEILILHDGKIRLKTKNDKKINLKEEFFAIIGG